MIGWITKDKDKDGDLCLHTTKPVYDKTNKWWWSNGNYITINEFAFPELLGIACETPIKVKIDIKPLDDSIPLTKEILDKNFKVDEKYYNKYMKESNCIPYIIKGNRNWNLIWENTINILRIEDDPLIEIRTIKELNTVLKLCKIQKEIII